MRAAAAAGTQRRIKSLPEQFQEAIRNAQQGFNYDKVKQVMDRLGWTYFDGAPNLDTLKETGLSVMSCAVEDALSYPQGSIYSTSTGGFRGWCVIEKGRATVGLEFIVEEFETSVSDHAIP